MSPVMASSVDKFALNPNCKGSKILYFVSNFTSLWNIHLSTTLLIVGRIDIGLYLEGGLFSPNLKIGVIFAIFRQFIKLAAYERKINYIANSRSQILLEIFKKLIGNVSLSCLVIFKFLIIDEHSLMFTGVTNILEVF